MGYLKNGKYQWIIDLDVRNTKGHELDSIYKIYDVKVDEGFWEVDLDFTAYWTGGYEIGWMSISRRTGNNCFCLSW